MKRPRKSKRREYQEAKSLAENRRSNLLFAISVALIFGGLAAYYFLYAVPRIKNARARHHHHHPAQNSHSNHIAH